MSVYTMKPNKQFKHIKKLITATIVSQFGLGWVSEWVSELMIEWVSEWASVFVSEWVFVCQWVIPWYIDTRSSLLF